MDPEDVRFLHRPMGGFENSATICVPEFLPPVQSRDLRVLKGGSVSTIP